ncbi:hypothetical protein RMATCC62417_06073 [Rhizopus microsporus]|nr:hypothetical protein RMATCC62417_06073 [Rhizopus microsporus]
MHLQRDKSVSSPVMDSFAMVTQSFINDMHAAGMSFDTKHNPGTQLQVILQLPEEEEIVQAEPHRDAEYNIEAILKKNGFGKLCKMTGAYEQPDNKLLDILNMEFHEKPELLVHIAELLANGIVRCKNVLIKVLTVEAYSRHASVDIHNESQVLESTLPVQGRLFCGTVSAADGKGLKQKMVIASKTMNALCTCSVTLGATPQVSIDPDHASKLNPRDCQLFLASAAVAKFKEMVAPENDLLLTCTPSMSHLRQFTTSFHHPSTFNCWRRTFEPFNDILHMPATVFTLCDLPSFSGYGSNSTSVAMLSSQLLALWARAYFHHNNVLTEVQMATFMILYDSAIKDSKPWVPLQAVVQLLKKEFNKSSQVKIFQFAFVTSLSAVADTAGDSLSAANAKIATNIFSRFSDLFLDN